MNITDIERLEAIAADYAARKKSEISESRRDQYDMNIAVIRLAIDAVVAAPELLEALKSAVFALAWHEEKHSAGMDRKIVQDARAAIAKAEGAQP